MNRPLPSWAARALTAACTAAISLLLLQPGPGIAQENHADHHRAVPGSAFPSSGTPPGRPAAAGSGGADAPPGASPARAPRTLLVGPGSAYATLDAALAAVIPGDTVRVGPGVYTGRIVFDRRVTLLGARGAVLRGDGTGTVVTMAADSSAVEGFRIEGSGRSLNSDDAAIKMESCRGCRARANVLPAVVHGVYVLTSPGVLVADNRISGDESLAEARRGNGIHVYDSRGSRIFGNRIRGTRDGIYFSFASGATVADNVVTETRYGLHYMYSDDNGFERNEFRANTAGAALMFSKHIEFRGNRFTEHVGLQAYGLLLQTVEDVRASGNLVAGNRVGLHMDNVTAGAFRQNLIAGNGVGIDLQSSAENNVFAENEIRDNRLAARQGTDRTTNRWSDGGRGNFWASPEVFDLDGDGVGDRPLTVGDPFAALAVRRPALEPFVGTPAARALSWAERSFPVFDVPRAVDPAPLVRSPLGASIVPASIVSSTASPVQGVGLFALAAVGLFVALAPVVWLNRALGPRARTRNHA